MHKVQELLVSNLSKVSGPGQVFAKGQQEVIVMWELCRNSHE